MIHEPTQKKMPDYVVCRTIPKRIMCFSHCRCIVCFLTSPCMSNVWLCESLIKSDMTGCKCRTKEACLSRSKCICHLLKTSTAVCSYGFQMQWLESTKHHELSVCPILFWQEVAEPQRPESAETYMARTHKHTSAEEKHFSFIFSCAMRPYLFMIHCELSHLNLTCWAFASAILGLNNSISSDFQLNGERCKWWQPTSAEPR